jgi:hypothetical protein
MGSDMDECDTMDEYCDRYVLATRRGDWKKQGESEEAAVPTMEKNALAIQWNRRLNWEINLT